MPTSTEVPEPPYGWIVVWACFVSLAVIFGVAYAFAALFESFATDFAADRADVSLVFGLSGLIYFTLGIGGGMLADRFGPRAVCCIGMVFIAAGLLATSFAQSLLMVYLSYGVGIGIGIALVYTPSIACVQPWFTRRRGLAAGIASAGIGAGTLLIPLLVALAITVLQWRDTLRVLALLVLLVGVGAASLLRRAPSATASELRNVPGATLREALHGRAFWCLYLVALSGGPIMFIPFAHISAAARDIGVADAQAVALVGMIGIGSLVGRFAIGALADRIGRGQTLVLMQLSMGASYLLWHVADGYTAFVLFALWFGLSYGGIVSLLPALCMDLFGARAVAGIIGSLYSGAALGNLLGPVVAGAVFDRTGSYTTVIWSCIALSVVAVWSARRLVAMRQHNY